MTTYGPPLRFKAVNTETGEVIDIGSLDMLPMYKLESLTSVHVCTDQFDIIDGRIKDYVIVQSTGLTDSRGVEIFGGDVLSFSEGIFGEIFFNSINSAYSIEGLNMRWTGNIVGSELAAELTVIGNRWQSREELEKRAEKVTDDA